MTPSQLARLFVAISVLVPSSAAAAEAVASGDGGFAGTVLAIVTALASAAIVSAIKSWSDVQVLKKEVESLEKDLAGAADKVAVQESLARIEKRLDKIDERFLSITTAK